MLTPIRVRGRRKEAPAKKPNHKQGTTAAPSGPKGGRPLMSHQARLESSQSRSSKRARLWVAGTPKSRKSLSRLETLPVELIERIFLYALNVNLPRSSLSLAAAVSSERIYRVLILVAFWNDSAAVEGGSDSGSDSSIARILRPLDYVPLRDDERGALQASILRCRWCTARRLLDQLPDMMNLTIQRHWVNPGIKMAEGQRESLDRFLAREGDTSTYDGTGHDNKHYTLTIAPFTSITIRCAETDDQQTHKILRLKHFPEKLLSGIDDVSSADLETLRLACGLNHPDHLETAVSVPREALQQGIQHALVANDAQTLTTLLKIDEYVFRSSANTPYTLPAEHFRTAVRVARTNPTLFQHLLRASAESVPADDPEITEWAMRLDGAFGHWLLDLMMRLPRQIEMASADPLDGALFYLGRANGRIELARRYLGDVLGVQELSSWMEETFVDLSCRWVVSSHSSGFIDRPHQQ